MEKQRKNHGRKKVISALGKNLRQVLEDRKLSAKAGAEITGVAKSVFHGWMNGVQCNDPGALLRLCETLKVDFQWLLTGTHGKLQPGDLTLNEIFDVEDDAALSGVFLVEAKRLKRKKQ